MFYQHRDHVCFFFTDTATTEIYTLSLHDALPISGSDIGQPEAERFEHVIVPDAFAAFQVRGGARDPPSAVIAACGQTFEVGPSFQRAARTRFQGGQPSKSPWPQLRVEATLSGQLPQSSGDDPR